MKVLMYENRKCDPSFYDASTPAKESAAYLRFFRHLDDDWDVYCELAEDDAIRALCSPCAKDVHKYCEGDGCICKETKDCLLKSQEFDREQRASSEQRRLYLAAKGGDGAAAKRLLIARRDYEYEHVYAYDVYDPEVDE